MESSQSRASGFYYTRKISRDVRNAIDRPFGTSSFTRRVSQHRNPSIQRTCAPLPIIGTGPAHPREIRNTLMAMPNGIPSKIRDRTIPNMVVWSDKRIAHAYAVELKR